MLLMILNVVNVFRVIVALNVVTVFNVASHRSCFGCVYCCGYSLML